MKKNVSEVVKNGLCTSCGICIGICYKNSIKFNYGSERNEPIIDSDNCVNCGLCYDICPGKGVELVKLGDKLFSNEENVKLSPYCGHYLNSYTGHSTNEEIRYHSASGGMLTTFLLYLLKNHIIDGAVVVGYNKDDPFTPEAYIATSEKDILRSRGSKYIVTSFDKVVKDIIAFEGRLVVVGLPCHIQGLRNLASKNKRIKTNIIGYFSIYCSLNKTKHSIDYYLSHYKVDREKVGYFTFRDDGCMGYMKFVDKKGKIIVKVPYVSFWYGSHSFFQNKRCILCADHFGELADISFGDINISPYNNDKIGISSMVTRTVFWDNQLKSCEKQGYIKLNHCPINDVNASQSYSKNYKKGKGIQGYIKVREILGLKIPKYDILFEGKPSVKNYIGVILKYLMLFIGKHKSLWFIIHAFDRSNKSVKYE